MEQTEDPFRGFGVRCELPETANAQGKEKYRDAFLKIRETLTRIGVASRKEKNLYQSAHILHKRNEYAILHFKELFSLDGKPTNIDDEDIGRRNRIVKLLEEWGLLKIINPVDETKIAPLSHIKTIKHSEKSEWKLFSKYAIGAKKKA